MKLISPPKSRRMTNHLKKQASEVEQIKKKPASRSVEKKKRKVSLEAMTNFQISSNHLNFLMQEQRINEMKKINSSVALSHYYQALMSLFMVSYTSAKIITSNLHENNRQNTPLSGLKFVGVLFSIYETVWNEKQYEKLKIMAKNVMRMAPTAKLFQDKIEFVCRKITLNFNMQSRIELAFVSQKLTSFWEKMINRFRFQEEREILESMYQIAPQRLAYWDYHCFVNQYLVDENFYYKLLQSIKSSKNRQNDDETLYVFTFEFILIEIFSLYEDEVNEKFQFEQEKNNCTIF